MKKLAILGCTGSIGRQTADIVGSDPDKYKVVGLSCGSNAEGLFELASRFGCNSLGLYDANKRDELNGLCRKAGMNAEIFCGEDALTRVVDDADIVVVAVVGMIGLKAVLYALDKGKTVALANKESLVAGGGLVMQNAKLGDAVRPIDSEHSAVWQCLRGEKNFKRIILTASGGPFYFDGKMDLKTVTPEQAVAHPTWRMGRKISVDSATMMNKALEIIEARWLFDTENIDYTIHPESVVHSMIEFDDGSIKAQASFPDMRLPIQYALEYPDHCVRNYTPLKLPLDMHFYPPEEKRFRAPALARSVVKAGGNAGVVFNAANEAAVALFLDGKIGFTDIVDIVEDALNAEPHTSEITVDSIFDTHKRVYNKIYLYRGN